MKFIEYDKIQFTNFNIFENYFKTKINLDFKKNNVIKINSFNLPKFIYHLPFLPLIKEDRDIILKDLGFKYFKFYCLKGEKEEIKLSDLQVI